VWSEVQKRIAQAMCAVLENKKRDLISFFIVD
jgi:hypothetical protein